MGINSGPTRQRATYPSLSRLRPHRPLVVLPFLTQVPQPLADRGGDFVHSRPQTPASPRVGSAALGTVLAMCLVEAHQYQPGTPLVPRRATHRMQVGTAGGCSQSGYPEPVVARAPPPRRALHLLPAQARKLRVQSLMPAPAVRH